MDFKDAKTFSPRRLTGCCVTWCIERYLTVTSRRPCAVLTAWFVGALGRATDQPTSHANEPTQSALSRRFFRPLGPLPPATPPQMNTGKINAQSMSSSRPNIFQNNARRVSTTCPKHARNVAKTVQNLTMWVLNVRSPIGARTLQRFASCRSGHRGRLCSWLR